MFSISFPNEMKALVFVINLKGFAEIDIDQSVIKFYWSAKNQLMDQSQVIS